MRVRPVNVNVHVHRPPFLKRDGEEDRESADGESGDAELVHGERSAGRVRSRVNGTDGLRCRLRRLSGRRRVERSGIAPGVDHETGKEEIKISLSSNHNTLDLTYVVEGAVGTLELEGAWEEEEEETAPPGKQEVLLLAATVNYVVIIIRYRTSEES